MRSALPHFKTLSELFFHPLFVALLVAKLVSAALFGSFYLRDLFIPFVTFHVESGFSNPWEFFLARGEIKAFPYPPAMLWILSIPFAVFSLFMTLDWRTVTQSELFIARLPLLASDLAIYSVLGLWFRNRIAAVRLYYWCSPIVFYICYFHGQLDIIPTALFVVSLYLLNIRMITPAGALFGLAIASKSHLLVAVPFLMIYLVDKSRLRGFTKWAAAAAVSYSVIALPYWDGAAFQRMVLQADEQQRVFAYQFPIAGESLSFYLCPAALMVLFLRYLAYPKRNWDLTLLYLGIAFCTFVVLVPPMQGWFMWGLPFIMYFFCRDPKLSQGALHTFSIAYLAYFLFGSHSDLLDSLKLVLPELHTSTAAAWLHGREGLFNGLSFTAMETSLAVLIFMMYRAGVRSNEVYRTRERPVMIGVAGDSGVGKDTFVELASALLGAANTIAVSGDDYHKWERNDEQWKVFTHLDVKSNRLHELADHTIALRQGRPISKVSYCHKTGKFTEPEALDATKHVIMAGLHTFVIDRMRAEFDLKIFLDPDESLRRFWKVQRDVAARGYDPAQVLAVIESRSKDREAHILPQHAVSDVIFQLFPLSPINTDDLSVIPELGLRTTLSNGFNLEAIEAALSEIEGLEVSLQYQTSESRQTLTVAGSVTREEIERVALSIVPNIDEVTSNEHSFQSDIAGLMQLLFLTTLSQTLLWSRHRPGQTHATPVNTELDTWYGSRATR